MFTVIECASHQHDIRLVALAGAICALGNLALFILLKRAADCVARRRRQWLAVAAVAEGTGIWATHFVSMLAYHGTVPLRFDAALTGLSVVLAIGSFWIALRLLDRVPTLPQAIGAGFAAALGVSVMHFTGMASILTPVSVHYVTGPIVISFALAWCAFAGSFIAFAKLRGIARLALPTISTLIAVVVLHFGAMASTRLTPIPGMAEAAGESMLWLVPAIVVVTLLLILLVLTSSFVDRLLTDLRGLTDATMEGLMIVHEGAIIEVNRQLCALLGRTSQALLGSRPEEWLIATSSSGQYGEATVRGAIDPDQVLEITAHEIEYRGRACHVLAARDMAVMDAAKATGADHDHLYGAHLAARGTK